MPTAGGKPKRGEVWELRMPIPGRETTPIQAAVLERTRGDYYGLRVFIQGEGRKLWVDPAYWVQQGWLKYVGPAGPKTRERLGL